MINRHDLTCNGTKCSASQDQSKKRRDKATKMELDEAILGRFEKTKKIPWPRHRTRHGQCKDCEKIAPGRGEWLGLKSGFGCSFQ